MNVDLNQNQKVLRNKQDRPRLIFLELGAPSPSQLSSGCSFYQPDPSTDTEFLLLGYLKSPRPQLLLVASLNAPFSLPLLQLTASFLSPVCK